MPSIGDIANDIARLLYDFRIPVVVLSIGAVVVFVIVAVRRGWFAAARRHPGRTAAVVAVALVIVLPLGWYLGSPLIIRTSLVEAAPTAPPVAVGGNPESVPPTIEPTPSAQGAATAPPLSAPPTAAPTPTPFVPSTVASGAFEGTDDFHFGTGTATIIEIEPGRYHLRLEDFSVRNGPDLYVYLSPDPDGYVDGALEVGTLKATDGSFGYDLPDGFDPSGFESTLIWCKQFSHLFATAAFVDG
jgi:Electron transfer DM13